MKIYIDPKTTNTNQLELVSEHAGRLLKWNISAYDPGYFTGTKGDACRHINAYWSCLENHKQQKIFEIYCEIRNILEHVADTESLITLLLPKVKELYEEHTLEEFEHWISFSKNADIIIPDKFEEVYISSDQKPGTRDKTYTKPDYRQLVALSMQLRVLVPVWGEFINLTKAETGTNFKEFEALKLLTDTAIINSVPMVKLKTYVESNILQDKSKAAAILGGVSSQDYPKWLLSLVLIRRLCIGDVSGVNPTTHLVAFIYNYINQKITANNTSAFGQIVKDKLFENQSSSDDHNVSRTEGYKIKQDISIGGIAVFEHYMSNPHAVGRALDPNFDLDLLNTCLQRTQDLHHTELHKQQIVLSQLVLAPVFSPRAMVYLSKKTMVNAIAVTQVWLWQHNHKQLSVLVSAIASNNDKEMYLGGTDSRARITKEQGDILQKLYPYTIVKSSKQKTKPVNDGMQAIDVLMGYLSQRDWILTAPNEHAKFVTGVENLTRYSCPHDIRQLIANLVIDLKSNTLAKL